MHVLVTEMNLLVHVMYVFLFLTLVFIFGSPGLCCCMGLLSTVVLGPLMAGRPLVAEHRV